MSSLPRMSRRATPRLMVLACAAAGICAAGLALAQATPAPATGTPSTARPPSATPAAPSAPRPAAPARAAAPGAAQSAQAAPPSPEEIFSAWDKDKNRSLSLVEFKAGWDEVRQASMMSRIGAQFRTIDVDRDNALTPAEYANLPLIKRAGSAAPPMATFDTDRNGKLDFREYIHMVEGLVKSAAGAPGG